ncbi:MAG: 4Fe-4S dicluster domain-containing protein [Candidatus Heimdallarchaeota archaeon]|nr:4Fe-4S dicluster domain-containing protein [Candidatus Heimdallarchaeota archaeon]MCK4771065.1 4Fe-4S dicluster domain-containing protein [Candidatus Heimdallarchaeota archaeon]
MGIKDKTMIFFFKKQGLPKFKEVIALEDSLADKEDTLKFSDQSPERFDIPLEIVRRNVRKPPLVIATLRYILSSMKNIQKSVISLNQNPKEPKTSFSETELQELENCALSLNICSIGYTKVPEELVFHNKAIIYDNAIVLAMKMDNKKINKAPSKITIKNIWETYDNLGKAANKIAEFLRSKGYSAQASHPLGGLVLYPPLAQLAGMGYFGFSGLLITPENGPTVRLAAVYTSIENLPFNEGNEHSWVREYCAKCGICIDKCPPQAIYKEPIFHETGRVTHIDNDKCFPYFSENHGCTVCIKVCPFNNVDYYKLKENFEKKI